MNGDRRIIVPGGGRKNSGQLVEDVERFAADLQKHGIAFAIVIGIPGVQAMRWWSNISRFGRPGLEEFERQIRHLVSKVAAHIGKLGG